MTKIVFTEEFCQPENLYPFTLTRQIQDIRVGILTIREKWESMLGLPSFDRKEDDYKDLDRSVHIHECLADGEECLMIHGNILPTPAMVKAIKKLKAGEFLSHNGAGIVYRISGREIRDTHKISVTGSVKADMDIKSIHYPWDIFLLNDWAIREDFKWLRSKKKSQPISKTNQVSGRSNIFIAKGATVEHCIINAETGPVYIGKDALVMEGCIIRGPFAMNEGAVLKLGTKVYGATTLGPYCTGGGEIKNSILFGYSNKAHDGYLGDSVLGEWCNLGAGTTNSNLKNSASDVKVWTVNGQKSAGNKCGVLMGDYSRTAINTSINTGTVIGVSSNVFGSGLTPCYIPSFSWGSEGIERYKFDRALDHIAAWKKLKKMERTAQEESILRYIFDNF